MDNMIDLTYALQTDEDSLDDNTGLEDFDVTLRINESITPELGDRESGLGLGLVGTGEIPHIAFTPMTPPSGSDSPDGHSTVSLNSSTCSPLFQKKELHLDDFSNGGGGIIINPNTMWRSESPFPAQSETEAKDFFAYRDTILNHVVSEVQQSIDASIDGSIKGTWLLTEIDFWNHEWERLIVLCDKVIVICKYDFIGMKIEDTRRLDLTVIDKVIQGELAYPLKSLTPKLNGIAEGIAGVVKDSILPTMYGTVQTVSGAVWRKSRCGGVQAEPAVEATEDPDKYSPPILNETITENGSNKTIKGSIMSILSLDKFESKPRNAHGIQMIWNEHQPLSFNQKWNPFDKSIPRLTFTCHPLFWHKGGGSDSIFDVGSFDVDSFARELVQVLTHGGGDLSPSCRIEYKPIVIESYVGIASLLHNANSLGFYKVRGKVSF